MDFLRIFITAPASIIVLFFLSKLIGNKQIANLNIFDYINGITIGSIAAEMATCEFNELANYGATLVIYSGIVILLTVLSQYSVKLRRFFTGKTIVLYDHNKLYKKNFKTAKLDFNEFLAILRNKGYFCLDDIEAAFFEQSGDISVLPKESKRPLTPDDIKVRVQQQRPEIIVILDGKIMYKNLKQSGNNKQWLLTQLKQQKKNLAEIYAAVCDGSNNLKIIECSKDNPTNDIFE